MKTQYTIQPLWKGAICFLFILMVSCEKKHRRHRHHSSKEQSNVTHEVQKSTSSRSTISKVVQTDIKAPSIKEVRTLPPLIKKGIILEVSAITPGNIEVLDDKDEVMMQAQGKHPHLRCLIPSEFLYYKINFEPADQSIGTQRIFTVDSQGKDTSIVISRDNTSPGDWLVKRQDSPRQPPQTITQNRPTTKTTKTQHPTTTSNLTPKKSPPPTKTTSHTSAQTKPKETQNDISFEKLKNDALGGNAVAQLSLGVAYSRGKSGAPKDLVKAAHWFELSAKQGNRISQYNIGRCYYLGIGREMDNDLAFQWFLKAANQGYADAQFYVGRCYQRGYGVVKNIKSAVKWLKPPATKGDPDAQLSLGVCYYQGGPGVPKDRVKATHYFELSAKQGNAASQYNLGRCYYFGEGRKKDYFLAFEWYEKAAQQDYPSAQNALGQMYFEGEGTLKDPHEAKKWLKLAFKNGNKNAKKFWDEYKVWKVK